MVLSKEWINPDRVKAVMAELGLDLNKEKTYVGTAVNGFEFLGFYFEEIMEENGAGSVIRVMPTEGSIEKVVESIESIGSNVRSIDSTARIEKAHKDDENKVQALDNLIKNIRDVVDPWRSYYRHTDYAAGLERIEPSFNEKIQKFI